MSIGELMPEKLREDHASRSLIVGSILRMHVTFTTPHKHKRLIVIGIDYIDEIAAIVCINSSNDFALHSPELLRLQHPLPANGRAYLDHNSFVDCSKLHPFRLSIIREAILKSPEIVRGALSPEDRFILRQLAISAKTISMKDKRRFNLST